MNPISSRLIETVLFSNKEVNLHAEKNEIGTAAKILLESQRKTWEQLARGYDSIKSAKVKTFNYDGFKINVQYNPNRILSTSAKVDDESIKSRKCFLCIDNLFKEQKGFLYDNEYIVLANPFPIFPEHFTIPNLHHFPQKIGDIFFVLLSLSKSMSQYYSLFYNGPKCGASAPDHLHFQAGTKNFMPIYEDYSNLKTKFGKTLVEEENFSASAIDDGLRRFIVLESGMEEILIYAFNIFLETYGLQQSNDDEPMMNILTSYEKDKGWRVIIFLREKHRPSCYFAEGENSILLSPASVDLGGICITPREEDFKKITKKLLAGILDEVSLNGGSFDELKSGLKNNLSKI